MATKAAGKKAPATKATPKPAHEVFANGKAERAPRASSIFAEGAAITTLVEGNPKREGSAAHGRYELYKKNKTVAKFIAAGGTLGDLRYDVTHGYIAVDGADLPAAEPKPRSAAKEKAVEPTGKPAGRAKGKRNAMEAATETLA